MTERELKELARLAAEEVSSHPRECPLGLDHGTAAQLKDMADTWRKSRSVMFVSIVGLLVTALFGVFGLGVIAKIKEVVK